MDQSESDVVWPSVPGGGAGAEESLVLEAVTQQRLAKTAGKQRLMNQ
jgi:hypothetical protein